MKIPNRSNRTDQQGFSLLKGLVTIVIIAMFIGFVVQFLNYIKEGALRSKTVFNSGTILLGCNNYAEDHNGYFPSGAGENKENAEKGAGNAENSQHAFNDLMPTYIDGESLFWYYTTNPARSLPPVEDGKLKAGEVSFAYVTKQSKRNREDSPLISHGEMSKVGEFNSFHRWLKSKRAIVGFVGGHVAELPLTSKNEGATAMSHDQKIKNIFKERKDGGLLDTDAANVLLPEK